MRSMEDATLRVSNRFAAQERPRVYDFIDFTARREPCHFKTALVRTVSFSQKHEAGYVGTHQIPFPDF